MGGVVREAEEAAPRQPSAIDVRMLGCAIDALGEAGAVEPFEPLHGSCGSNVVESLPRETP